MSCLPRLFGQLRPGAPVILGTQILATHEAVRCQFQTHAVFRRRQSALVASTPLSYLRVVLDVVSELHHAGAQLRHAESARGRQV